MDKDTVTWKEIPSRPRVGYRGEIARWRGKSGRRGAMVAEVALCPSGDIYWDVGRARWEIWQRKAESLEQAKAAAEYALQIPRQFHPVATAEWQDMAYGFAIRQYGRLDYLGVVGYGGPADNGWRLYKPGDIDWFDVGGDGKLGADANIPGFLQRLGRW